MMIVRVFNSGTGSAKAAIKYLMGDKDHTGKIREVAPALVHGSPSLFSLVTDCIERKHKYTSGAIAFRDNEQPDEKQIKQIIAAFKATFLPGLASGENYSDMWIEHRDKGNLELHFVFAATEIFSNKQLNIHPPGKVNLEHYKLFTQVMNYQLGYSQVYPDPLKIVMSEFETKSPNGKKARRAKHILSNEIKNKIVSGQISNRDELVSHLNENYGEVTRVGENYISFKFPGTAKAKRLKGPLFSKGADYKEIISQHLLSKSPRPLSADQANLLINRLNEMTQNRADYFSKKYLQKKTSFRPKKISNTGNKTNSVEEKIPLPSAQPKIHINAFTRLAMSMHQPKQQIKITGAEATPANQDESNFANDTQEIGSPIAGFEIQLGMLAMRLSKLVVVARTAQGLLLQKLRKEIANIEAQMSAINLQIEKEKLNAKSNIQIQQAGKRPKI